MLNFVCGVARVPTLSVPKKIQDFSETFEDLALRFPGLSSTGNFTNTIPKLSVSRTFQKTWKPW